VLSSFIVTHREELIRRCGVKLDARSPDSPSAAPMNGIPQFLDQLVDALDHDTRTDVELDRSAARHGRDLQLKGFTVSQVVHDYGDVCQSITDLAVEVGAAISVSDFRTLNRCLDDAIASAVTEHGRSRPESGPVGAVLQEPDRFGFLVHEIRNLVNTGMMAFSVLDSGDVGVRGSTGGVLQRSLVGLRDLIDRSVAEVRVGHSLHEHDAVALADVLAALTPAAEQEGAARGLQLSVVIDDPSVVVCADRQMLTAAIVNLLQNAFKFTRPATTVTLSVTTADDRVLIEVADECGGLPGGTPDAQFRSFEQRHADRTGLGLGLAFSKWAVEANGGSLSARSVPPVGCVFTIDVPRAQDPPGPACAAGPFATPRAPDA
jgi:signal transduction histidine kinase